MPAPLPFDGSAIGRLRAQLGLSHDDIAHAMRTAYGVAVDPGRPPAAGGAGVADRAGPEFLAGVVDRFWTAMR
ncbi:hypothetical protein [Actinacidiphila acidipaludis]|uniref:XRE family transcriptional regulator n=1 Tax=Actinacidiphila acidipaludis TaxID=2873382 RepID=A0ABS7QEK3_9ACTN|nr:hypothetical protein [Streptomyces acidipaludis]MBY8881562.1 hypothetical protein [Streptomyces acidipaludis]